MHQRPSYTDTNMELVEEKLEGKLHDFRFGYVTKVQACMCGNFHVSVMSESVRPMAPLSMGFSRQEYWSRLPCPSPGVLPDPGIQPASLNAPALVCGFFTTKATWEATSVTKAQGTEEKQVSQCSSKLKMFLHQISYKESENQSTEREEKPLQIIFMIKLN